MKKKNITSRFSNVARRPSKKKKGDMDQLPRWNLADLYTGLSDPKLTADKDIIKRMTEEFSADYKGKIKDLNGEALGRAIARIEEINNLRNRLESYIELLGADDIKNFSKTVSLQKWLSDTGEKTDFFIEELRDIDEQDLLTMITEPSLLRYAPWLAEQRSGIHPDVSKEAEKVDADYSRINEDAWVRMYREFRVAMTVSWRGKKLTISAAEKICSDKRRPLAEREALRHEMGLALKAQAAKGAIMYNAITGNLIVDAELLDHDRPDQSEHMNNGVGTDIADTIHETVKASYGRLSQRFFSLKQGMDDTREEIKSGISFDDAIKIVLRAFNKLSPRLSREARKFFDEKHIDAAPRRGKNSGAFAQNVGADDLPYILLNYDNSVQEVSAIGHELGHGVQMALSNKKQGAFLANLPSTTAEIPSIFSEMLVFDELLRHEKDPAVRHELMLTDVQNMIGTAVKQLSWYDFEHRVCAERKKGELDAEQISDIWVEVQRHYNGPAFQPDETDRYSWMLVPHLFETPFYVYSYTFSQLVVNGLYRAYKEAEQKGDRAKEEFAEKYMTLLETGTSKSAHELLAPFGINLKDPGFWESGLRLIEERLDAVIANDNQPQMPVQKTKARKPKR